MGLFRKKQTPQWVLDGDVQAAYGVLRSFRSGIPTDQQLLVRALTLVVLDRQDRS